MIDVSGDVERARNYLAGRLTPHDRETLEARLIRDPALLLEIEQTQRIREGIRELSTQGYFAHARSWHRRHATLGVTAALALLAGLAVGPAIKPGHSATPALVATAPTDGRLLAVTRWTFVTTRGSVLSELLRPATGVVEFRAVPGLVSPATRYRMTLNHLEDDGSIRLLGRLHGLAVRSDGFVHWYADTARLPPGRYELRMDAEPAGAIPTTVFPFNLSPPH